jgi:membrane protein
MLDEPLIRTGTIRLRRRLFDVFPPLRLREALTLGGLSVRELVARTWRTMNDHEVMTRASAVAFYAMLAAVPFLGIVLLLIVQLLPDLTRHAGAGGIGDRTLVQLEAALAELFPQDITKIVEDQIVRIQKEPPVGLLSIGVLILLWSASTLYTAIIDAMNRIAGVKERRSYVKIRLVATLMAIVEATILVGSLVAIVGWSWILRKLGLSSTPAQVLATAALWVGLFLMVLLSFAVTFYIAPDADQRWEWITPGSLLGTVVFMLVTFGFRLYVQNFANYDKTYGPLGGVMVLMFWFWISSVVLLTSAQINKVIEDASPLGKNYGQKVDPTEPPDLKSLKPEPASP